MRINRITSFSLLALCFAGCATKETVTTEKHGQKTIIHHKRRVANGSIDRIEAVDAKGIVTQAEIHVFDVGRLPTGNGGMSEAHRVYQVVQDSHFILSLPKKVSSGPRTVYTPPNYVPPPEDQRINDAITEAQKAKKKLDDKAKELQDQIAKDNNLRGELNDQITEAQALQDKLTAQLHGAMDTPKHTVNDAQKAAESELQVWGAHQ